MFRFQLDIQLNSAETSPNSDVDLIIHAQPNSYVGLLAVDQNVGLLRNGYDIVHDDVSKELEGYDDSEVSPYLSILGDQRRNVFWKPGSSNAKDIFQVGQLVLNLHWYSYKECISFFHRIQEQWF